MGIHKNQKNVLNDHTYLSLITDSSLESTLSVLNCSPNDMFGLKVEDV